MFNKSPKRIAIIGLPGSGKSTFACKLGSILNIPVHHLDKHLFDGKQKRNRQEFLTVKEALVSEDSWIIEGCSLSTLEMRFARADIVIYFQLSRLLCVWRLSKRFFTFDHTSTNSGCLKGINWELLKYMWNFDRNKSPGIKELREQYPHVEFVLFRNTHDSEEFLNKLRK